MNRSRAAVTAIRRRHRKAAKTAHARNRGRWSGYDGEQKHCAVKAAFKAFMDDDFSTHAKSHQLPSKRAGEALLNIPSIFKQPLVDQPQPLPAPKLYSKRRNAA